MSDATPVVRVLHVRNSDRLGGPERLILDQVAVASPAVAHVVASFGREGAPHPFLDAARAQGVDARLVPQRSSYDPRLAGRLAATIAAVAPDLLVGHDYKADLLLAAASRRRGALRRPRVAVVHGYTAEDWKVALLEAADRRALRGVAAVVAPAAPVRDALVAARVPAERIHAIENGIAVERVAREAAEGREAVRASWGLAAGDVAVVSIGRLSPEKGPDVLLAAYVAARGRLPRGARLVVVGDGAAREAVEAAARAHEAAGGLRPGEVVFTGWRADATRCLGAADVFVLASRREGLPLACLEAMAAGVPVVATRVGGVPEALEGGACGCLVSHEDAAGLADAIAAVVADPAAAAARAARARERVRSRYGVERQARALEALYASVRAAGAGSRSVSGDVVSS